MPRNVLQDEWSKYWDKAYGYFWRRLSNKSQIEDLTCEVLHTFFLSEQVIDKPEAFFWSIVRHKFLAHLKSKKSRAGQVMTLDESHESYSSLINFGQSSNDLDTYDLFYEQKVQRLLQCVYSQLSNQDATIVEMSVMCDFASQRVATELQLSAGNVRVRLSRALAKLRDKCRQIWD